MLLNLESSPNPADFGLDPEDSVRHAGKPADFLTLFQKLRDDLAPVGATELKVVDEIVHFQFEIERARPSAERESAFKLERIEEDAVILAENPKLALCKEERLIAERLSKCLIKRELLERNSTKLGWEENESVRAAALDDLIKLRWRVDPRVARELRQVEAHGRRQIKELLAELRRLRTDRGSHTVKTDRERRANDVKRMRSEREDQARRAEGAKPAAGAGAMHSSEAQLLAATTVALAATLLQGAQSEAAEAADGHAGLGHTDADLQSEGDMLAAARSLAIDPRAAFLSEAMPANEPVDDRSTRSP